MEVNPPKHRPMFSQYASPWHKWFAWRPVTTWDGRLVWLKVVYRRRIFPSLLIEGCADPWMEYHSPWGYVE